LIKVRSHVQRRVERRGRYADPWALIEQKFGPEVLASTDA
jgi:hypothetical protein